MLEGDELRLEESPGFTESGGVGTLPDGVIKAVSVSF